MVMVMEQCIHTPFFSSDTAMTERCLIAASLAVLLFHPSLTIRCFKPKPQTSPNPTPTPTPTSTSTSTSPQKERHSLSKSYTSLKKALSKSYTSLKKALSLSMTKSKKRQDSRTSPSVSRSSSTFSSVGASPPATPLSAEVLAGRPLAGTFAETIFRSGWAAAGEIGDTVEKVLKVNNSVDVLHRFEEYREMVKSKAKENRVGLRLERLEADGNELLMFHGAVITCSLGSGTEGGFSICSEKSCGACRFIGSVEETTTTTTTAWLCGNSGRAHEKVATECIVNGLSPATRNAIILCKVIAGRVVRARKHGLIEGEKEGFDSLVSSTEDRSDGSEELMVLNPRAILPCFVIIYNVGLGTAFR